MLAHPEDLAKTAWGNDIDIMIGATSFENGRLLNLLMMDTSIGTSLMDLTTWVPYPLNKTDDEKAYFAKKLQETYYGRLEPTPLMYESILEVTLLIKF
jgi:hypothetical protein